MSGNDIKRHLQLLESMSLDMEEEALGEEELDFDNGNYDLEPETDFGDEDVDAALDDEIESSWEDQDDMGFDDSPEEYDMDMDMDAEVEEPESDVDEEETITYNYTATIQVHGFDFPLVLQADDIDEIKTVMRVLRQSGLNPHGEYKWNSKMIDLNSDDDQVMESVEEKDEE